MESMQRGLAPNKRKLRGLAALIVVTVGVSLAGCASAETDSPSGESPVDELTVSYTGSGTATLPLFIAEDRGYFEDADLKVTMQGFGTAPYPQAVSGEVDVVSGDHIGALQAAVGGLPLVFLGETSRLIPGIHQFVATEASGLREPKDLKGARIGMASLVGSGKFALDALLESAGLTQDDVEVSKIAYDALGPALELGNIDVAHLPGTFLDAARQAQDLHTIADFADLPGLEGLAQAGYYTTQAAYDENPKKFEKFMKAYQRAAQDAIDDEELLTEFFVSVGKTDPDVASRLPLPSQIVESDPKELQRLADMAFDAGLLDKQVSVGEGTLKVADFIE